MLVHGSFLHHEGDVFQQFDIHKGIPIHRDHVRRFAGFDGADEVGVAEQIRRVMSATNGNKSRAAKVLGIERKTLYRKLERMGL